MKNEKDPFNLIITAGCGEIGSSIVLSIAAQSTDPESVFYNTKQIIYDTNPHARKKLLTSPLFQKWREEKGLTPAILDENITFTTDPGALERTEGSSAADLVVLAVPVAQYANAINKLLPFIDRSTIVTDEGSSKMACVERAVETLREHFGDTLPPVVPAHIPYHQFPTPLQFLVKTPYGTPDAEARHRAFRDELGVQKYIEVTAEAHDKIYGTCSHFNHLAMSAFLLALNQPGGGARKIHSRTDVGRWLATMVQITNCSPNIWAGVLIDNATNLADSIDGLLEHLHEFADLVMNDEQKWHEKIDELHDYAKDKPNVEFTDYMPPEGADLTISAFAAFLSAGLTANIKDLEGTLDGIKVADFANPSCRRSLGIMAHDPEMAKQLTHIYKEELPSMLRGYENQLRMIQGLIRQGKHEAVDAVAWESKHLGDKFGAALSPSAARVASR